MAEKTAAVTATSAGEKVTIACKVAVPWLDLELSEIREVQENTQTGPRTIKMGFRTGQFIRVRGTAYPVGQVPMGFADRPEIVNGYALTHNIPKDVWEQWLSQHKKDAMVLNHMIMAYPSLDQLKGETADFKALKSGLEPINPKGDPRAPKSNDPALTDEGTEDRFGKKFDVVKVEA